ncbi:MAG: hypothetical protein K8T25_05435 [Planctomycetia bacterium]|nr:hypothetical protein [Planctomycetia bacterium]
MSISKPTIADSKIPNASMPIAMDTACSSDGECQPCLELLRRIDADLAQWGHERAQQRRRIAWRLLGVAAALCSVVGACLLVYR